VLGLGKTLYLLEGILDCLSQAANLIRDSQIFRGRAWSVCDRIGARSGNVVLQTRQSLASQVTSQIVGPEINVTFRYNPKKVRRAWGISQVIIDQILGWFLETT
jgi:hypothetical protein